MGQRATTRGAQNSVGSNLAGYYGNSAYAACRMAGTGSYAYRLVRLLEFVEFSQAATINKATLLVLPQVHRELSPIPKQRTRLTRQELNI